MACQNADKCSNGCNNSHGTSTNQTSSYWIIIILYILLAIVIGSYISWY